jgi:hypothetical protein
MSALSPGREVYKERERMPANGSTVEASYPFTTASPLC